MPYKESPRYQPKTETEYLLYPSDLKTKPSQEQPNLHQIKPQDVKHKLYPDPKERETEHYLTVEPQKMGNLSEQLLRKEELNNFITAIHNEYPQLSGTFSNPFTFKQLVEKFKDYRNIDDETPLFEKFSDIKIMRLLQILYHSGIVVLDSPILRTYKIDYKDAKNPYINPRVF